MGNKNASDRKAAHAKHEQRRAHQKVEKSKQFVFTEEFVRAAASHIVQICPEQAAKHSGLPPRVVMNIASGRFQQYSNEQIQGIGRAANAMGWTPPVACQK